jgi:hypothetical protein
MFPAVDDCDRHDEAERHVLAKFDFALRQMLLESRVECGQFERNRDRLCAALVTILMTVAADAAALGGRPDDAGAREAFMAAAESALEWSQNKIASVG